MIPEDQKINAFYLSNHIFCKKIWRCEDTLWVAFTDIVQVVEDPHQTSATSRMFLFPSSVLELLTVIYGTLIVPRYD